jgi:hypothetical protein
MAEQVIQGPSSTEAAEEPPPSTTPLTQGPATEAGTGLAAAPPLVHDVLRSPGQPLEPALRANMVQRFGHDFSRVRVHLGAAADESVQELNATAYTVGQDIVFGTDQFAPETHRGQRLIAHELTHVVQQSGRVAMPAVQRRTYHSDFPGPGHPLPHTAGGETEEKPVAWSRKHTRGPRLLDGDKPSYQVWFDHILPPVPKGVTQLWQVVEVTKTFLTKTCEEKTEKSHVIDVVDIGKRANINDNWGWVETDDPCFAMEVNEATVGFDDQKSGYAQQTSVKATEKLAKDILTKMTGPKGTYSGTYTFAKSANCKDCSEQLKKLQEKHKVRNGEALQIDGVGSWTS